MPRRPALFAALSTALSGFLDAIGFAELSELYVSFMSGNTTHLAVSLAHGRWSDVVAASVIILAFIAGAATGTWIIDNAPRRAIPAILVCECLVVMAASALACAGLARAAMMIVAIAMGMQNLLHQVVRGSDLGKSFLTGTLFSLGQALARWRCDRTQRRRILDTGTSWLSFVAGAVSGTLVLATTGIIPALALAILMLTSMMIAIQTGIL